MEKLKFGGGYLLAPVAFIGTSFNHGGRRQIFSGGAMLSDDDVMISLTSLFLQKLSKILVGL